MNKNSRVLPHLNVCFLQKKAYDVHRKKIEYIKHSLRNSLIQKSYLSKEMPHEKLQSCLSHDRMSTIKEQATERYQRLNPLMRRKIQQNQKENYRLIKRIECSTSTINRKEIQNHMIRSKIMRDRLCKFKYNPDSKKTELKSVHSLQRLERIKERDFDQISSYSRQLSYNRSRIHESKSLISRVSKQSFQQNTQSKESFIKKGSFDRLMAHRNSRKVNVHFGNDEFVTRAQVRLEALKNGNSTEIKRYKQPEPVAGYWKSRCFTTQIESYN